MGTSNLVVVDQVGPCWIVRVFSPVAEQDFRCFSKQVALEFAAVFQRAAAAQVPA